MLEKISDSEKELSEIKFERLKNALVYIKNNLIDFDTKMYLTFDSLIHNNQIDNSIITSTNNIFPRKVIVKSCGYDECTWIKI